MPQISDMTGFLEHPLKGVSTAFAILFTISGALHIWQSSKYKSWLYTWLFPCACLIFTAGFICREYTAYYPTSDITFTAIRGLFYSAVPIITGPLYLFLPRLLATQPSLAPIRPISLCTIPFYVTFVIISLTSQGASFFNPSATDGSISADHALLKASLIMQLFLNVFFIAVIAIFYHKCSSKGIFHQAEEQSINIVAITLSISMAWIFVRNLFSTVQIFLPSDSPAWTVEAYFWVFEATPMLACTVFLHILHPAKHFQIEGGCYTARSATRRVTDVEERSVSAGRQCKG